VGALHAAVIVADVSASGAKQIPCAKLPRCGMTTGKRSLAGQLAQELVFIHLVLEGFAAVDEDYRDFVSVLTAQLFVGVHINFLPMEAAVALQFGQAFLDNFAQVAAFARVNHDLAWLVH
jgi:hypothetical protein